MKTHRTPAMLWLLTGLAACSAPPARDSHQVSASQTVADSAFAGVQHRGHVAMRVDQYTSTHHFEPTPDGGLITLERDVKDSAGVAQIRHHMLQIAAAFQRGDFAIPGFVHDRPVPGTEIMTARRAHISYRPDTLARGGALRISSQDPEAVTAIHQFLAFQRRDHRVPDAENSQ
ncbi:MAG TPA: hypothetical protein VFH40_13150 [Gemmatimonadales bacterium]|nr:hypothetical protein [Gemmatimonadales bacterium]